MNLHHELSQSLDIARSLILSDPGEARRLTEHARQLAEQLGQAHDMLEARRLLARIVRAQDFSSVVKPLADALLQDAAAAGARDIWLDTLFIAADSAYGDGMYADASERYLGILEAGLNENWARALVIAYTGIAKLCFIYGEAAVAERNLNTALQYAGHVECSDTLISLYINLAANAIHSQRHVLANAWLTEVQAQLLKAGVCEYEPELYYYQGIIAQREGRSEEARALFRRSLMLNASNHNNWGRTVNLLGLGEVAMAQGEHFAAEYYMREALLLAIEINSTHLEMQAHRMLAEVLRKTGETRREFEHWQRHFALLKVTREENRDDPLSRTLFIDTCARQAGMERRHVSRKAAA
ncbi:hypothetical protein [Chitinilyticum litopenaei]|uniref:hypothetical protein n=1 Tax=Chitinilyticum litopenaei TaxID=1121276 RepID=UPI0004051804|nr:hypothetical protein [Chitinilyticum litopenaei]